MDPPVPGTYTLSYTTLFRSPVVRERHPELVFHVRERPHPAQDDPRADLADELDRQPLEGLHRDVRERLDHPPRQLRSEEHTSELQSQSNLVCRLLLEKKKNT